MSPGKFYVYKGKQCLECIYLFMCNLKGFVNNGEHFNTFFYKWDSDFKSFPHPTKKFKKMK